MQDNPNPDLLGPLSFRNEVWLFDNFNDVSVWLRFNHDSENDSMSKSAYSAVIRSSFGTKLWMLRWRNEIDEENIALIPEQKNKKWIVNKYTFKINE